MKHVELCPGRVLSGFKCLFAQFYANSPMVCGGGGKGLGTAIVIVSNVSVYRREPVGVQGQVLLEVSL